MKRYNVKAIARAGIIVAACWNLWAYTSLIIHLPARETNDIVICEKLWAPFRDHLKVVPYDLGDLGYVTARMLRGETPTEEEKTRRAEFYYVVIPLNLVENKLDAPLLLADFTLERPAQLPPGFEYFFDPGNGLALLKRTGKQ